MVGQAARQSQFHPVNVHAKAKAARLLGAPRSRLTGIQSSAGSNSAGTTTHAVTYDETQQ